MRIIIPVLVNLLTNIIIISFVYRVLYGEQIWKLFYKHRGRGV